MLTRKHIVKHEFCIHDKPKPKQGHEQLERKKRKAQTLAPPIRKEKTTARTKCIESTEKHEKSKQIILFTREPDKFQFTSILPN